MNFLVISQRAYPTNKYNLKDLTGHGRIDVLFRCILAATRELFGDDKCRIHCFLKGKDPYGWLNITPEDVSEEWGEIELASFLQKKWSKYFHQGTLEDLVNELNAPFVLLAENGETLSEINQDIERMIIVLGAQNDLTDDDLLTINPAMSLSLGQNSMLASQAITYFRQKYRINLP